MTEIDLLRDLYDKIEEYVKINNLEINKERIVFPYDKNNIGTTVCDIREYYKSHKRQRRAQDLIKEIGLE
jgi:hypothetical protein